MSTAYFLTMLKEAARYRDMSRPYWTNFNRMSMDLFNEDDDLVLYVRFSNGNSTVSATVNDKGKEEGNIQDVFNMVSEYVAERRK